MNYDAMVIQAGVKKMLNPGGHFSVCDFDNLCKVAKLTVPGAVRDRLAVLHCMNWRDMPPDLHQQTQELLLGMFRPFLPMVEAQVVEPPKSPGIFARLMGGARTEGDTK